MTMVTLHCNVERMTFNKLYWIFIWKKMNLVLYLTLYTKINFRCIIVLNVKMIKLYKDKFENIFMTSSKLTFLKEDRTLSIKIFLKLIFITVRLVFIKIHHQKSENASNSVKDI